MCEKRNVEALRGLPLYMRMRQEAVCACVKRHVDALRGLLQAFLHLRLSGKQLKNMDGLFGRSDPFYKIFRIDEPGEAEAGLGFWGLGLRT